MEISRALTTLNSTMISPKSAPRFIRNYLVMLLLVFGCIEKSKGTECQDLFKTSQCEELAKHKACDTHFERMMVLCRKTCKLCHDSCASITCPLNHICLADANGTPFCKCTIRCTQAEKRTGPVCARNGKTYQSTCIMKKDQCRKKKKINVYHYGNCIKQDPCVDAVPKICKKIRDEGVCLSSADLMQFYCPVSCRMCRQPAPPAMCYSARYGCCWNSDKAARGPNQEGCDPCSDKPFCIHFKSLCSKVRSIAGMRKHCPKTCGYC